MKKLLLVLFPLVLAQLSFGQAMPKGKVAISTGIGLGIYEVSLTNDTSSAPSVAGAARVIPISLEYGISDRISAGVIYQPNKYITGEDDSTNTNKSETVVGRFIGARGDYHFTNTENFDLYLGVAMGYDNIRFEVVGSNDEHAVLGGGGFGFQVNAGLKVFFGKHIGIFFAFNYANFGIKWNRYEVDGEDQILPDYFGKFKFRGGEAKTGLILKF